MGKIKVGICPTFFNFINRAKHLKLNYKRAKIERKKILNFIKVYTFMFYL